jgi:Tfp pilus assembly protein PilF
MNRRFIPFLLLTVFIIVAFHGCSRPFVEAQLQFGILAAQKDLWDEAIFRWKKVVLSAPRSAAAHNNLAVAYEKKGLWKEAEKEYETALKLDPQNSFIKTNYQNFKDRQEVLKRDEKDEKK